MKCKKTILISLLILTSQFLLQSQKLKSYGTLTQDMAKEAARIFLQREQTNPARIVSITKGEFTFSNLFGKFNITLFSRRVRYRKVSA